jgi:predicted DNA-binding transcriptional regulator YafY
MVGPYGFYVALGRYHFVFWKDLALVVMAVTALRHWARHRQARKELERMSSAPLTEGRESARPMESSGSPDALPGPDEGAPDPVFTPDSVLLESLRCALCTGETLTVLYRNLEGAVTLRAVRPSEILHRGGCSYVRAFCMLRGCERVFRVDRMAPA